MIARLYACFGIVGIASILCWGAALAALPACYASRRRTRLYAVAFALSLLGLLLAKINSSRISNIEILREEPPPAPPAEAKAAVEGAPKPKAPEAAAPEAPKEPPASSYREAGKQEREEGKKQDMGELTENTRPPEEARAGRAMSEADAAAADRFDRMNLFFARWVPWLALLMVGFDYLSRFNRTRGYLFPLPIAGRAVDTLFPKTHSVLLTLKPPAGCEPAGGYRDALRRYLEDTVRKGETFIYCGPADLWDAPELCRLPSVRGRRLWPLRKIRHGADDAPTDARFVFDSAWFGRYCFVATDAEAATALLASLVGYLEVRRVPRAAARRTVHVVWHFASLPPSDTMRELLFLCPETNFKLAVVADAHGYGYGEDLAPLFEEQVELSD